MNSDTTFQHQQAVISTQAKLSQEEGKQMNHLKEMACY